MPSTESIMKIAMGFMAAKYLFVASEVGLFEALADGPATLDALAKKRRPHREHLRSSLPQWLV
jgi:hypothetical protein